MASEWQTFIDELKQRNDIVDVIGSYTPVVQKGRSFWAACPFHHEKTPSFSISKTGQFYKCFGCGASGDVIRFVEEYESVSFVEAVEILAKRVGMKMPERQGFDEKKAEVKKARREKILAVLKQTALFYHSVLLSERGKQARDYLEKRGVTHSAIKKYALGYSPDFDSLPRYLFSKGFEPEICKAAGVVELSKKETWYDVLFNRVIVPVISPQREVLAFGGRTLEKNPDFAKYKNTTETEVFVKSKCLYNANIIKELKQKGTLKRVIMTEGYMDVIGLGSAGVDYAVASMGTSLTTEQARLLKRYTEEVYICYDGDSAGQAATVRGLDILKAEGLNVRVMSLPDGLDPDEVIRLHGKDAFVNLMEQAKPLVDYKIDILEKRFDLNAPTLARRDENRVSFAKEAAKVLAEISDNVERKLYAKKLSQMTGLSEEFLLSNAGSANNNTAFQPPRVKLNRQEKALSFVAACMLADKDFVDWSYFPKCDEDSSAKKTFDYIADCRNNNQKPEKHEIFAIVGDADNFVLALSDTDPDATDTAKEYDKDCVTMLMRDEIDYEINLQKSILANSEEKNAQIKVILRINELIRKRNALK